MAGTDEARARQVLGDMLERLNRGPHEALGVSFEATQSDIRSAFLALTKQYHPARFARMSSEVQRLANEVFLALRIAHDQLLKPAAKAPQPPRTATPQPGAPLRPRPSQPPATVRAGTVPGTTPPPNLKPASSELSRAASADRSARSSSRPPPEPIRPPAPAIDRVARTSRPPDVAPIADASGRFPRAPTATPAAPTATTSAAAGPNDRELAGVLDQLQRGQFEPAQRTLAALAARSPGSAKYKALIAYGKGREAQLARRVDEARVELQQALQLDPDLQLAKTALAELFTRRK
ncbi:MAG: hypothetical protein AB7O24_10980 [Kofleriaceae bacterium]